MKFLIIQNPTIKNLPLKYNVILDKIIGLVMLENNELFNKIKQEIDKDSNISLVISDIKVKNASIEQIYDEYLISSDDFKMKKNKVFIEKFLSISDDYSINTEDDDIYILFNMELLYNVETIDIFEFLKLRLINTFIKYRDEIINKYNEMIKYPLKIEEINLDKIS